MPTAPRSIEITDCRGFDTGFQAPYAAIPSHVPPGWGTSDDITYLQLEAFQCNRVGVGPFERGPLFVALEWHNNVVFPERCQPDIRTSTRVLAGLWVSDLDIATYLNGTMGMPAQYAQFDVAQDKPVAGMQSWTFGPPGMAPSEMRVQDLPLEDSGVPGNQYRLAWVNGQGGVSYLDWIEGFGNDNASNPTVVGTWRAPLLYTDLGAQTYVSAVDLDHGDSSGTFAQFKDLACSAPA